MIRMPMLSVFLSFIVAAACVADDGPEIPVTFEELWAGFDPRADPLDTLVVREWEKDSVVYRYVTFHVGTC